MKKRLLAILLAALMIVSLLPTMALAKEADCTYTQKVTTITDGESYQLKLGGKDAGWFKFEAADGGWKISKSSAPGTFNMTQYPYLAMKDGKLSYTDQDNATVWTYKNGAFSVSTSAKTTQKTGGRWIGFIYLPGSSKTVTVTTTYYLSTVTNGAKLSTNCVKAELYTEVTGEHDFGYWIDCKDGANHKHICKNCDDVKTEAHSYDETTHKCVCGAFDPAESSVKISVDVKEKTSKQFSGFLFWGTWKDVTTYTATIKTEAKGVKVTKVQYRLNDGKWMTGTSVSSSQPIETLEVKAWDNKGNVYSYTWPEEDVGNNLTIGKSGTFTGGPYDNVIISASVGNGDVTLENVIINGKLIVQGGGSESIHINNCEVDTIQVDKDTTVQGAQTPRIELSNTPVESIEAVQPVIIEAKDEASTIAAVEAQSDVTVQGTATKVDKVTVPENASMQGVTLEIKGAKVAEVTAEQPLTIAATDGASPIEKVEVTDNLTVKGDAAQIEQVQVPDTATEPPVIDVQAGTVSEIKADKPAEVKGDGTVTHVEANAEVTVASGTVVTVTVTVAVTVTVTGDQPVEVAVETTEAVSISAAYAQVEVTTTQETAVTVQVNAEPVAHVHKWTKTDETPATCSVEGSVTYTCSGNGDCDMGGTKTEKVEKLPHTVVVDDAVPATCEVAGKTVGSHCSVCQTVIDGSQTVPALGHDWADEWSKDESDHWHECQREGCNAKTGTAAHTPGAAATEETAQTCTVCGYVITPALGHICKNHLTAHEAVAATCTTAGNSAYWSCTCGKFYSDANAENEIAENSWVISALGHDLTKTDAKSTTCEEDGNNAYWTCSRCHKVYSDAEGAVETTVAAQTLAATGHNYGAATYEWTAVNGGYTCTATRVCANNGNHKETETVTASYAVTTPATYESVGQGTYTATFTKEGFATQTKTEDIFYEGGAMATGWQQIGENRYYFDPTTGAMATGWKNDIPEWEGFLFYFDPITGAMATGWKNDIPGWEGSLFYFYEDGVMAIGWQSDIPGWVGSRLYFDPITGEMATGWKSDIPGLEGSLFYFDPTTGAMATGWKNDIPEWEGSLFYFDPITGAMATGWKYDIPGWVGSRLYFDPITGAMATGLQQIGENLYYFDPITGAMKTGWQQIGENLYYFDPTTGAMATGQQQIGGNWYFFDPYTGAMTTGGQQTGGDWYFLDP